MYFIKEHQAWVQNLYSFSPCDRPSSSSTNGQTNFTTFSQAHGAGAGLLSHNEESKARKRRAPQTFRQHATDSSGHVGVKCASAIRLIWIMKFWGEGLRCRSNISNIVQFFLLFIHLIKSSTAHIDVQTKPPVLMLRCLRPVHINMIWCAPSAPSQHHLIRGLPLSCWGGGEGRGGEGAAGDDCSGGFVSWDFNETLWKHLLGRCSQWTWRPLAMSQMCNIA